MIASHIARAWHCNSYIPVCLCLKTRLLEVLSLKYNCSSCHASLMYVQTDHSVNNVGVRQYFSSVVICKLRIKYVPRFKFAIKRKTAFSGSLV